MVQVQYSVHVIGMFVVYVSSHTCKTPVFLAAEAEQPDDWDEEEDGEWEPPKITNPACESAPGCGEWKRPTKPNPNYKGKWSAPLIDNPAYKVRVQCVGLAVAANPG